MSHADLKAFFKNNYDKGPFLAGALYREFYKKLNPCPWHAEALRHSPGLSAKLKKDWDLAPGEVVEWIEQEGVVKFVTLLRDMHRIETVVISMATHLTVCVSSQVGCSRGCRFCETAKMGFIRNLDVQEITGQIMAARRQYGKSVRNVVFMGMGEPMDNRDAVFKSIQVMNDQRGLDIALRRITLSTAGVVDGIRGVGDLRLRVDQLEDALAGGDRLLQAAVGLAEDLQGPVHRHAGGDESDELSLGDVVLGLHDEVTAGHDQGQDREGDDDLEQREAALAAPARGPCPRARRLAVTARWKRVPEAMARHGQSASQPIIRMRPVNHSTPT
jgi:hypothetical protein